MQVFRITSEISKQVFPLELDLENPKFLAGLERLLRISNAMESAKSQGGVVGRIKWAGLAAAALAAFGRLYLIPSKPIALPDSSRLVPAW